MKFPDATSCNELEAGTGIPSAHAGIYSGLKQSTCDIDVTEGIGDDRFE